jgi:hypothetical protein
MLGLALRSGADAAHRTPAENLLQVITPTSRGVAKAHPGVNVVVAFGAATDGTPADPSTFHARIRGKDVTAKFTPVLTGGVETGLRATLEPELIRLGPRPRNRLHLTVEGTRPSKGKRLRDVDNLRFGAADAPDGCPLAVATADTDVVVPGAPVTFDGSQSSDPEEDVLTYMWDFGDGTSASGVSAAHAFATSAAAVTVTLHVSDGQCDGTATLTLPTTPTIDPGKTLGTLAIESSGPLELGVVPLGTSVTHVLTVKNVDTTPTSQVKVRAAASAAPFGVTPAGEIALGPGEASPLTVAFTPSVAGHAAAQVELVVAASNRHAVAYLAHGYGGTGAGSGPTLLASPVFAQGVASVTARLPDGTPVPIDVTTGTCVGRGVADACVVSADCGTPTETCTGPPAPLDATELCSDGTSLYLLVENTFTDPNPNADTPLTGSLVQIDLAANGATTGKRILFRPTDSTQHIACDATPAGQGGFVYMAEFFNVNGTATCFRDERDALVRVNKGTGAAQVMMPRMDKAVGLGDCDDRDPVDSVAVTPDASAIFAGFDTAGLWQVLPTPLGFTPDVSDGFRVHPDGSVVFAIGRDSGATGSIDLYRVAAAEVEHGALPVTALTPCASVTVPNNVEDGGHGQTTVGSLVVGSTGTGRDATALVTFVSPQALPPGLLPFGNVQGTVAFALPADTTACSAVGVIGLDASTLWQ